mgnify:CR=1 FL=1
MSAASLSDLLSLAFTFADRRNWDVARSYAQAVLLFEPRAAMAHHVLGRVALAEARGPEALDHLAHAARLAPQEPALAMDLARSLRRLSSSGEAIAAGFLRACHLAPANLELGREAAVVLTSLASAWIQSHQGDDAAVLLETALALAPESEPALRNLAIVRMNAGQHEAARQLAAWAADQMPRHLPTATIAAHLELGCGNVPAAVWRINRSLQEVAADATAGDAATGRGRPGADPDRNAAIFYHPDGYTLDRQELMGRHTAGDGFLRGFLRHGGVERLIVATPGVQGLETLAQTLRRENWTRPVSWLPLAQPQPILEQAGTLYIPEPNIDEYAWRRRRTGNPAAWSLCGVTHTTATHAVMSAVGQWLRAPVESWDAVICTSEAVRRTVESLYTAETAYLRERLGPFTPPPRPQLPIIPLGIQASDVAFTAEGRQRWRQHAGIGEADVAALFVGRLCLHTKGHPLPMFAAMEMAARAVRRTHPQGKIHLLIAGWFTAPTTEAAFRTLAAEICPSVTVTFLDGRLQDVRREIWSAADVFLSFADNIQETFGLTPLEAMAAGLPVVVSDWNGYRETVRDGVEGFRIPTWLPPAGHGQDYAALYEDQGVDYSQYCGTVAQFAAVDAEAAGVALARLFANPALRRQMGDNGRRRVAESFDWRVIIPRYQDLWQELTLRRRAAALAGLVTGQGTGNPARPDPLAAFSHYATATLSAETRLTRAATASGGRLAACHAEACRLFHAEALLPLSGCMALLESLDPATARTIASLPGADAPRRLRTLAWMVKMGLAAAYP